MSIKEFAEKYIAAEYEAFRNGNFDVLDKLENPDVVYHIPMCPDVIGFEGHKKDILSRRDAITYSQFELKYLTGDIKLFVLTIKESGTVEKEISVFPLPVGTKFSAEGVVIVNLSDGKTKEVWIAGSIMTE